jgi:hypothetical protein
MERIYENFLKINRVILLSEALLKEFNSTQKQQIINNYGDNFTIAYEFEIDVLSGEKNNDDFVLENYKEIDRVLDKIGDDKILKQFNFFEHSPEDIISLIKTFPDNLKKINNYLFKKITNTEGDTDTSSINLISSVDNFVNKRLFKLENRIQLTKVLFEIFGDDIIKYVKSTYIPSVVKTIKENFNTNIVLNIIMYRNFIKEKMDIPYTPIVLEILQNLKEIIRYTTFGNLFPNFYKKYQSDIDIVQDATLSMFGLEIKNKKYLNGIKEAFEFIDDFYADLNKQSLYGLGDKTGLHVNIGYKNSNEFNLLKGFLLLNELDKQGNPGGMAYKGMDDRKSNPNTQPYRDDFYKMAKASIQYAQEEEIIPKFTVDSLKSYEEILNKDVLISASNSGDKAIGFNVSKISDDYIEFRYPGGKVSPDIIKEQTIYYANIVLACKDPDYRKDDYLKKLRKLVISIVSDINTGKVN